MFKSTVSPGPPYTGHFEVKKGHFLIKNRYFNVGLIWNYGFSGTYELYLSELGIDMDRHFREKLDKMDDKKRTYNINW